MNDPPTDSAAAASPALSVRDLRFAYRQGQPVLRGLEFDLPRGRIVGFLGPNGSGKSTTVKILSGMLPGYQGEVRSLGLDPATQAIEIKRRMGYVPEAAALFEHLRVAEHLLLTGRLHGLEDEVIIERGEQLLAGFGLKERMMSKCGSLSKGMRQKLLFCSALLHRPEILFVDEPLSGLDVDATVLVKEILRGLADRGLSVFYCSHVLDVVERVCDEVLILHEGVVCARGTIEELERRSGESTLEEVFRSLTGGTDIAEQAERILDVVALREARL